MKFNGSGYMTSAEQGGACSAEHISVVYEAVVQEIVNTLFGVVNAKRLI